MERHITCTVRIAAPLFQDSGLLSVITDPIHTPVTLFWPTDKALQALPPEQQDLLFNRDNKDKLKEYLKFHVIRDSRVVSQMSQREIQSRSLAGRPMDHRSSMGRRKLQLRCLLELCALFTLVHFTWRNSC